MSSQELTVVGNDLVVENDRKRALAELNAAAEQVATPQEAREIMVKSKAIRDVLEQVKAPWEQSWLAGKASVVSSRRLARMLSDLSSTAPSTGNGAVKSERWVVGEELGISPSLMAALMRLSRVEDAEFQRYIQSKDKIPSLYGALRACAPGFRLSGSRSRSRSRRVRVGVKSPANPSLDEAYSLIVRSLGHLSELSDVHNGPKGGPKMLRAVGIAIDHLYAAEDLLKPYRAGYVDEHRAKVTAKRREQERAYKATERGKDVARRSRLNYKEKKRAEKAAEASNESVA